ncbi:agmatine/peptidylarginine deiminase [Catenovulum maritimum]|uniref:Agmatine deiminase n=1 Tax=Catenovulum maritimum TaxID=1513271 RepID=A0A0J8JIB8_9ALTE|nr:agmatine deiminase family protein [Catenovulum maritimum]KMT64201.1 agmatine deiminase [Catenovulum maritimum]
MNQYYLPPEWHKQDAIMLTWPHSKTDWASQLKQVEAVYFELVAAISQYQKLVIVCHDTELKQSVIHKLKGKNIGVEQLIFVIAQSNDTWARDHGPITLVDSNSQQIKPLNFTFNAWGDKFSANLDNQINKQLFEQINLTNFQEIDLILEGGSIEADGNGTLMTTAACLLNTNRNKQLSKFEIEEELLSLLGLDKMLWLTQGALAGDDTDAHIDTLARFAPNNQIIYQACDKTDDIHYQPLNDMAQELAEFKNKQGQAYQLIALPWPDAQYSSCGERLPATYANFLILNQAVLMPAYGVVQDELALTILKKAFPEHDVLAINCRPIIEQFGSLHCLTMQLPAGYLCNLERKFK